ncbi:MAG TPA: succinate dehydrogenase, hydrophobic membrane anchor protein [Steroidobacteraceae bacterium]
MSLRTPLGRVLNQGAARDGVHHWLVQRVTAVALAPLSVWLTASLLRLPNRDYETVTAWIAAGLHPVLMGMTVLLAAWHAWLGIQVVIEDYIGQPALKALLMLLSAFTNALLLASGVYALLRIALRSQA